MARKLLNVCVVFVLLMGCYGGVLAAAVCPHMGCETKASAPGLNKTQGDHGGDHCHKAGVSAESSSSDKADAEHSAGHAPEGAAGELQRFGGMEVWDAFARPHEGFCAHCVGSPETPPSSLFEQQTNPAKKNRDLNAPPAAIVQAEPASIVFRRKIAPAQHAPPGSSGKHLLLLNVFRI